MKLLAAHPDVHFIVNHTLMPFDRSEAGLALWREGLVTLARFPNVALKLSGLGMSPTGWSTEMSRRLVREAIERFGPGRCLFASNFPVDRLMVDYDTLWNTWRDAIADFSPTSRPQCCAATPSASTASESCAPDPGVASALASDRPRVAAAQPVSSCCSATRFDAEWIAAAMRSTKSVSVGRSAIASAQPGIAPPRRTTRNE